MYIGQIGIGQVGHLTTYTIIIPELADTLTVCDVKLGLAAALIEGVKHATPSSKIDIKIIT